MVGATIPDDSMETLTTLPPKWDGDTPIPACEAIGKSFIDERRALALVIPSAVSPGDENVLINPSHSRFRDIVFDDREPFAFDPRLAPRGATAPGRPL
jgi:RES domain-containing protein